LCPDLGEPLLQLLSPRPGELILDLGCGDGVLTEKIAAPRCQGCGVDASFGQVEAAKDRDLMVIVMDGHRLCFKKCDSEGNWIADYVRLKFKAFK
jgi:predicted TPR repeat methyltransferase